MGFLTLLFLLFLNWKTFSFPVDQISKDEKLPDVDEDNSWCSGPNMKFLDSSGTCLIKRDEKASYLEQLGLCNALSYENDLWMGRLAVLNDPVVKEEAVKFLLSENNGTDFFIALRPNKDDWKDYGDWVWFDSRNDKVIDSYNEEEQGKFQILSGENEGSCGALSLKPDSYGLFLNGDCGEKGGAGVACELVPVDLTEAVTSNNIHNGDESTSESLKQETTELEQTSTIEATTTKTTKTTVKSTSTTEQSSSTTTSTTTETQTTATEVAINELENKENPNEKNEDLIDIEEESDYDPKLDSDAYDQQSVDEIQEEDSETENREKNALEWAQNLKMGEMLEAAPLALIATGCVIFGALLLLLAFKIKARKRKDGYRKLLNQPID